MGFDLRRRIFMIRHHVHTSKRAVDAFWGFVHYPENADLLKQVE
jgi:hypothetical protein